MTVTLRNVDYEFLNIIESIFTLRKDIQISTKDFMAALNA